jgi:hypothetical protein
LLYPLFWNQHLKRLHSPWKTPAELPLLQTHSWQQFIITNGSLNAPPPPKKKKEKKSKERKKYRWQDSHAILYHTISIPFFIPLYALAHKNSHEII